MKKRILAFVLAALMLVSLPAVPGFAVSDSAAWEQSSEYYSGGDLQYGTAELRCGSSYTTLRFIYGSNVSMGESTLQDIAAELGNNDFPVISYPFRYENMGPQDFFIVMSDDAESIDRLILALDQEAADRAAAQVSQSDAEPEQPSSPEDLSQDEIAKLFDLVGLLNFSSKEDEVSSSDVSGSDVSGSDVSGSDVSSSDVSGSDVSGSDAVQEVDSIEDITEDDKDKLMALLGKLNFGSDEGSATVAVISGTDVSGSDVSATDAAPSDQQTVAEDAESTEDADVVEDIDAPEDNDEDADVSSSDIPEEEEAEPEITGSSIDNLLALHSTGIYALEALPTLEESFKTAFPEFFYSEVESVALNPVLSSNVTVSDDGSKADVLVIPAAEYVDIELNGKTFTVLLMNQKSTEYSVSRVRLNGNTDRSAVTATTTVPTTTVTEIIIETTTEATTTTTTAPTTAATTAATTTAATTTTTTTTTTTATTTTTTAATTTTTTTTAAPTAATTAPTFIPGKQVTGYVSTRSKRLRVRKGPGLGFATITFIPKGTVVTITGKPNNDWYAVRLNDGTEGYCYSGYITLHSGS